MVHHASNALKSDGALVNYISIGNLLLVKFINGMLSIVRPSDQTGKGGRKMSHAVVSLAARRTSGVPTSASGRRSSLPSAWVALNAGPSHYMQYHIITYITTSLHTAPPHYMQHHIITCNTISLHEAPHHYIQHNIITSNTISLHVAPPHYMQHHLVTCSTISLHASPPHFMQQHHLRLCSTTS